MYFYPKKVRLRENRSTLENVYHILEARGFLRIYGSFSKLVSFLGWKEYFRYNNDEISRIRNGFDFDPPIRIFLFYSGESELLERELESVMTVSENSLQEMVLS